MATPGKTAILCSASIFGLAQLRGNCQARRRQQYSAVRSCMSGRKSKKWLTISEATGLSGLVRQILPNPVRRNHSQIGGTKRQPPVEHLGHLPANEAEFPDGPPASKCS